MQRENAFSTWSWYFAIQSQVVVIEYYNYEFVEVLPVKKIELRMLSTKYDVRKLNEDDVEMLYDFCKRNTQYYEYCGKDTYVGFFER